MKMSAALRADPVFEALGMQHADPGVLAASRAGVPVNPAANNLGLVGYGNSAMGMHGQTLPQYSAWSPPAWSLYAQHAAAAAAAAAAPMTASAYGAQLQAAHYQGCQSPAYQGCHGAAYQGCQGAPPLLLPDVLPVGQPRTPGASPLGYMSMPSMSSAPLATTPTAAGQSAVAMMPPAAHSPTGSQVAAATWYSSQQPLATSQHHVQSTAVPTIAPLQTLPATHKVQPLVAAPSAPAGTEAEKENMPVDTNVDEGCAPNSARSDRKGSKAAMLQTPPAAKWSPSPFRADAPSFVPSESMASTQQANADAAPKTPGPERIALFESLSAATSPAPMAFGRSPCPFGQTPSPLATHAPVATPPPPTAAAPFLPSYPHQAFAKDTVVVQTRSQMLRVLHGLDGKIPADSPLKLTTRSCRELGEFDSPEFDVSDSAEDEQPSSAPNTSEEPRSSGAMLLKLVRGETQASAPPVAPRQETGDEKASALLRSVLQVGVGASEAYNGKGAKAGWYGERSAGGKGGGKAANRGKIRASAAAARAGDESAVADICNEMADEYGASAGGSRRGRRGGRPGCARA